MTTYTDTLTLSDGTRVEVTSTRTPQQRARFEHWCRLFGCWELKPTDDGMTAADWQRAHDAAAERAQRQTTPRRMARIAPTLGAWSTKQHGALLACPRHSPHRAASLTARRRQAGCPSR